MNFIMQKVNLHSNLVSLASKCIKVENRASRLTLTRLVSFQHITLSSKPKSDITYLLIILWHSNMGLWDASFYTFHVPCQWFTQMPMKNAPPPAARAIPTSEIHQSEVWTLWFCSVKSVNISTRQLCFMFNIACFRMTQIGESLENWQKCKTLENHIPLRNDCMLIPCSISPWQGKCQTPPAYKGVTSSQNSCHHHRDLSKCWGPCSAWWCKQARIINRNSAPYLEVLME